MKTKDNLLKGIIIGIGLIVVPLILMGTTNKPTSLEVGTYQISITGHGGMSNDGWIFETIIDTRTGYVKSKKKTAWIDYY